MKTGVNKHLVSNQIASHYREDIERMKKMRYIQYISYHAVFLPRFSDIAVVV